MKINHTFSIVLLLFSACFTSHTYALSDHDYLLRHVEEVSRDYFYIHLDDKTNELQMTGIVGGEHQTHYRILGFSGDYFHIEVESVDGVAYVSIDGEGVERQDNDGASEIKVIWDGVWIDIAVSASTFSSGYVLNIERVSQPKHIEIR
ncbi:hypothetical protein [Vibrio sp. F74]|uniref:hypothetical protein n=1 Tax=Vibrio sp. F74 TaxID=700020 RepID=UPI0035F5E292